MEDNTDSTNTEGRRPDQAFGPEYRDPRYYPPGSPRYQQGPPVRGRLSRRGWIVVAVVIGIVLVSVLLAAGFVVDRLLFPPEETSAEFVLEDQPEYQEALFDIRNYYYNDFSESEITSAANQAVEEAREQGVEDDDELLSVGLNALVDALEDEHSQYLTPEVNKRLSEDLSGSFFGVGFTLKLQEDPPEDQKRPEVVSVINGSPSEKAGVRDGDVILSVDDYDTEGESLDEVVLRIRGKKGTEVELEVQREGIEEPLKFKMVREKIEIPDFESEIIDGKYGWLRLYEFNDGGSQKVREAVKEMQNAGVEGFILDLRNNPGGLLVEAVDVTSVFVDGGTVVSYQTKGEKKVDEPASGNPETDLPLVVLVNGGSASSSEITAGALQELGRATLVGSKTYGKGSVQKVYDLDNGGAVKLTISLYFLPKGDSINGKGIEPDVVVEDEEDPEKEAQMQLDRAKEVLQNLIDGKPPTGELFLPAA